MNSGHDARSIRSMYTSSSEFRKFVATRTTLTAKNCTGTQYLARAVPHIEKYFLCILCTLYTLSLSSFFAHVYHQTNQAYQSTIFIPFQATLTRHTHIHRLHYLSNTLLGKRVYLLTDCKLNNV